MYRREVLATKGGQSSSKNRLFAEKKREGVIEELGNNNETQGQNKSKHGCSNGSRISGTINGARIEFINLKSNLKKTTIEEAESQVKNTQKRKVSWPDAHGKDIAHVQEFEPSVSEEVELEEVRNSCVCAIQ